MKTKRLRAYLRKLRAEFPPPKPVRVRQISMPQGEHGWTARSQNGFEVRIRKEDPTMLAMTILNHEMAHVRTFSVHPDHSAAWAAEYAQIVRWFSGETEYSSGD